MSLAGRYWYVHTGVTLKTYGTARQYVLCPPGEAAPPSPEPTEAIVAPSPPAALPAICAERFSQNRKIKNDGTRCGQHGGGNSDYVVRVTNRPINVDYPLARAWGLGALE